MAFMYEEKVIKKDAKTAVIMDSDFVVIIQTVYMSHRWDEAKDKIIIRYVINIENKRKELEEYEKEQRILKTDLGGVCLCCLTSLHIKEDDEGYICTRCGSFLRD